MNNINKKLHSKNIIIILVIIALGITTAGSTVYAVSITHIFAEPVQIINTNQNANGDTLILGPENASNLRLGYDKNYSWIQSHHGFPLSINPLGNNVGIGTTNPSAMLDVNGSIRLTGNILSDGQICIGSCE